MQTNEVVPEAVHLIDELSYAARSWPQAWRMVLKAEVMALGENPRLIVTSLASDEVGMLYEDLYSGRGQTESFIKRLKPDLASDRTSCTTFLANAMQLLQHAAAYVLHQQLRTQSLQNTAISQAQPSTVT